MPQERNNPYPFITAEQVAEIAKETPRERMAARIIMTRGFGRSIPKSNFLTGANDHSPIMKGVEQFAEAVIRLVDEIDALAVSNRCGDLLDGLTNEVTAMLQDHQCPTSPEQ